MRRPLAFVAIALLVAHAACSSSTPTDPADGTDKPAKDKGSTTDGGGTKSTAKDGGGGGGALDDVDLFGDAFGGLPALTCGLSCSGGGFSNCFASTADQDKCDDLCKTASKSAIDTFTDCTKGDVPCPKFLECFAAFKK